MESKTRSSGGATGLPRDSVTCQSQFEQETEKIFNREWIYIARESELDSDSGCLVTSVEKNELLIVRGDDGQIRIFRNFCRHRGSHLVTPETCAAVSGRIQCPYHAWTYDRSGALVAAPNMNELEGFEKNEYGLIELESGVWHGFIWVRFDHENGPSLGDSLSLLNEQAESWSMNELVVGHEIIYEVKANWKLIFQNYSECYHCPTVHPVLNRLTPYKGSSNEVEEGPILGGPMNLADDCATMSSDGSAVGKLLPKLDEVQSRCVYYYTLFPNLFISAHPDYVLLHRIERTSTGLSKVVCQFLFHPDTVSGEGFDSAGAIEFWDMTNRQDWHVCELAQKGMSDPGYIPGPLSNLESVVAAFDRHYLKVMK